MAFSPGTKKLIQKYGQNTGMFPEEKTGPRYARRDPPPGPSAIMYAPGAQQQQLQQNLIPGMQPSRNAPPPTMMGLSQPMGQRPASIEGVAPTMQHPLVSDAYFDDNQS